MRQQRVEYSLPSRRLRIVPMAGEDTVRADPSVLRPVLDMQDRTHQLSLRYPAREVPVVERVAEAV